MTRQRVPIIGQHFVREVPPSDNVGSISFRCEPYRTNIDVESVRGYGYSAGQLSRV